MKYTVFLIFFSVCIASAQKPEYAAVLIPSQLKENANAVVRYHQTDINISSRSSMTVRTYRAVTVLNELGQSSIKAYEHENIKSIDAVIYDASGNEIKKIKRKDFREQSVSQGSIISDTKVTYLDYTPTQYPFTVIFQSETSSSNTAFIPRWQPLDEKLVGVEKSVVNVTYTPLLGFKLKEYNFEGKDILKSEKSNSITYTAQNLPAIRVEAFSPSFDKISPFVLFGLEKFHLEGVDGEASTWEAMSAWNYNNLLSGTDELSAETKAKIKAMVGDEKDPLKKAKIIYNYVQGKTRYVNISLGIGGWKPMKAKDVDRLGYGDCKALSNYMRCLLNVVNVPSYYTVIYGDQDKTDLKSDFVSIQGNHIILGIPVDDKITWVECTSQTEPFGYQGKFTDDRMALLIAPSGGKLVRTHVYNTTDNTQFTKGNYTINPSGHITGKLEIRSKGSQYTNKSSLQSKSSEDQNKFYKDYFNINNLNFNKIAVIDDKDNIEFTEMLSLHADRYANTENNRLMFAVNAYNQFSQIPQRYRSRTHPFEISRGFADYDEITIAIPEGYTIEAKPNNIDLKDKFGEYKSEYVPINSKEMLYKRTLVINPGYFEPKEYENYRKFREAIAKADNAKMVLVKN